MKTFLLLGAFVATIQWVLRMFVFSWLCPPLYVVAALPLLLIEWAGLSTGLTGSNGLIVHLLASFVNSMIWGLAISALILTVMWRTGEATRDDV